MFVPTLSFHVQYLFSSTLQIPGPRFAAATKIPIAYYSWIERLPHWLHYLHERYQSDVVRISPDEVDIIAPQSWDDVHSPVKATGNFQKDLRIFGEIKNIVTANDTDHRRLRRLISHAFSEKALREQESILLSHIRNFIENMSSPALNGKVNITDYFTFLVFDIISDLSFGSSFGCQENNAYHPWVANLMANLQMVLLVSVTQRFPPFGKLLRHVVPKDKLEARKKHTAWTAEKVDRRLHLETSRPDFLTYITHHNEEPEKGGMTRLEIYQNAAAFMGAGAETTAAHLTATTYFLLTHPQYHEQLVREVRSAFTSAEDIDNSQKILERIPFLQPVIDEVFRIYPVALGGQVPVSPPGGAMVADHFIPGGTGVSINQYAANHSHLNFSDPEVFAPERWITGERGAKGAKLEKNELEVVQPFGVGARNCVGKKFVSPNLFSLTPS